MTDIATNLRRTRADMLGTDDEEHYWHCHEAAGEIDRLQAALERVKSRLLDRSWSRQEILAELKEKTSED